MNLRHLTVCSITAAFALLTGAGCSAVNTAAGASQGCNEFPSTADTLSIDANTKAFVSACATLDSAANTIEQSVLAACKAIDTDLGVTDTWTAKAPTNGGAPDDETKEACTQASNKIAAILNTAQSAQATCVLSVSPGQCTVDASVQASCEAQCTGSATCTPGDVTVRCDPGDLSVACSGTCNVNATCEGSASVMASCTGSCDADCSGSCTPPTAGKITCNGTCMGNCTGSCVAAAGTTMVSGAACAGTCNGQCDAMCMYAQGTPGHCEGTCSGTCNGNCKITAMNGIMCMGGATCRGGCSVTGTAPKCEGQLKPPQCNIDANCEASCQSHADLSASCTPPAASLECVGTTTLDPSVTKLVATLKTNLPALLEVVSTQGPLLAKAGVNLVSAGTAIVGNVGSLTGKAIACAGVAASSSVTASASINISVSASVMVSGSAGGPTS